MADHPMTLQLAGEVDFTIPAVLPHENIFLIQVGYKLFRLSGLSLSSDAPSYFTNFFAQEANREKVLFIDRNPKIFERIYNHLQGYAILIEKDYEFMDLWSDSFYFGLKGLQHFLMTEDIFASIGNESFKVSRTLFKATGNYPNFFTVLYDSLLVDVKIIEERGVLRPPPQKPASLPNRSPRLFSDLLELLRGNHLIIQGDEHRQLLVRECKYYRFLELEQRILNHRIINNPFFPSRQEIIINLNNLQARGVINESPSDHLSEMPLYYARPFIKNEPKRCLIFELDLDSDMFQKDYSEVKLRLNLTLKIAFIQITNRLCTKMMQVFKEFSEDFMLEDLDTDNPSLNFVTGFADAHSIINGREMKETWIRDIISPPEDEDPELETKKRKISRKDVKGDLIEFKLTKSLWRMMMRGNLARLHAVSLEGVTDHTTFVKEKVGFL